MGNSSDKELEALQGSIHVCDRRSVAIALPWCRIVLDLVTGGHHALFWRSSSLIMNQTQRKIRQSDKGGIKHSYGTRIARLDASVDGNKATRLQY